jgi:hypothetical protein
VNKNQKGNAYIILLLAVIIIGLGAVGYLVYQSFNSEKQVSPSTAENGSNGSVHFSESSSDWNEHLSKEYNYKVSFPGDYNYELVDDDYKKTEELYFVKESVTLLSIKVSKDYTLNEPDIYMDIPKTGTASFGDRNWNKFMIPKNTTLSDGANTTSNLLIFRTENNNVLYTISIEGQEELNDIQNQILSTFQFLER